MHNQKELKCCRTLKVNEIKPVGDVEELLMLLSSGWRADHFITFQKLSNVAKERDSGRESTTE